MNKKIKLFSILILTSLHIIANFSLVREDIYFNEVEGVILYRGKIYLETKKT